MPGEYLPPVVTRLTGDIDDLIAKIAEAKALMRSLGDSSATIDIESSLDKPSLAKAVGAARIFVSNSKGVTLPVGADLSGVSFARTIAAAKSLATANPVTVPVNFDANVGSAAAAGATGAAFGRGFGWLLNLGRVNLFSGLLPGILGSVGGLHLLIDSFAEIAAVVIPASIALAGFGIAASDAVNNIVRMFTAIHTVGDATGQTIPPMTDELEKLHAAVQPQVYGMLGDALTVINNKGGEFVPIIKGASDALSYFAARATVAITSSGLSSFMRNAVSDLSGIFNVFGNLAGTIGNILRQLPGYAQVLLSVLQNVTHALEVFTGSAIGQKIIGFGLAFHGAFLYIGLAATGLARLIPSLLGLFSRMAGGMAGAAAAIGGEGNLVARGLFGISAGAEAAAGLPWGWIALVAAGVGLLAYKLLTAKDAMQQWVASSQAAVNSASASSLTPIMNAQAQAAQKFSQASLTAANSQIKVNEAVAKGGGPIKSLIMLQQQQQGDANTATAYQQRLAGEALLYNTRLGMLARTYGSTTEAQELLTQAGVKLGQMTDRSSHSWAIVKQMVSGVVQGYAAMAQRGGVLGADLYVITSQATDQFKAMQSLNQSWQTFIGLSTGLETSAYSVVQAMRQVTSESRAAHTSFTGVNAASITMQQNFESGLIPQLQQTIAGMRQGGASGKDMATVISTFLNPAVQEGALRNQAFRQQIYAMARQADPGATDSVSSLTQFVNNNRSSTQSAMNMVNRFGAALNRLPKTESLSVKLFGTGSFQLVQGSSLGHKQVVGGLARGGFLPGYGGGDRHLRLLESGEAVVSKELTARHANLLRAIGVPGMAGGGFIPSYRGSVGGEGPWVQHDYSAAINQFAGSMGKAFQSAAAAASSAGGGGFLHPSGSGGSVEALMRSMAASVGWTGSLWADLYNVEMREAGFNLSARNPSSGAYGLAQFINGPGEYAQYGGSAGSAAGQITAMINYIKQRYGTPAGAWAHELGFGWYDQGGFLKPGWTMAYNGTGSPEPVGGAAGFGGDIIIEIDGKVIARVTQKQARRYNRRNGGRGTNKWAQPA